MTADDLRALCGKGIKSILSLQSQEESQPFFCRDALHLLGVDKQQQSITKSRAATGGDDIEPRTPEYFPTATAHGLLAILDTEAGCQHPFDPQGKKHMQPLERPTGAHVPIEKALKTFHSRQRFDHLLSAGDQQATWAERVIKSSSHARDDGEYDVTELVAHGHLIPAMVFLALRLGMSQSDSEQLDQAEHDLLQKGLSWSVERICELLGYGDQAASRDLDRVGSKQDEHGAYFAGLNKAGHERPLATYLLLNAAYALQAVWDYWKSQGAISGKPSAATERARRCLSDLFHCFGRRVDRNMAVRYVPDDTTFDALGLMFALRGQCLVDSGVRETPRFREGIATVVESQLMNGCWPDGAATGSASGVVTQQPSTEVAYCLAASVYSRAARTMPTQAELSVMRSAVPAIQKFARYLELNHLEEGDAYGTANGWASDRAKGSRNPETWITGLAVRFLHFASLIEECCQRARILNEYRITAARTRNMPKAQPKGVLDRFRALVIDPDREYSRPTTVISENLLLPIARKVESGRYVTRPAKSGVSFLLFGPPRSGKTYFVEKMAESLGWPLVELDPGFFTQKGNESVSAMAARVFHDLEQLHSTVVLFDELDELVVDRNTESEGPRNPVFMTASMLTRLARLHNARSCLFCFATNYYSRIDPAIRGVGRFDQIILFDRPDKAGRQEHLERTWKQDLKGLAGGHALKMPSKRGFDYLADQCAGGSFIELNLLVGELLKDGHRALCDALADSDQSVPDGEQESHLKDLIKRTLRSREEYVNWCVDDGLKDLNAAGGGTFTAETKEAIVKRWQETLDQLDGSHKKVIENAWHEVKTNSKGKSGLPRIRLE